ncbi:MAG: hypothetical protein ACRD2W_24965 [Acidimicrobiales bacterium]
MLVVDVAGQRDVAGVCSDRRRLDFESLDEPDRQALSGEPFLSVTQGPPGKRREVLGVKMFDDARTGP